MKRWANFGGKNIGQRVLPSEVFSNPRFEVTGEVSGTILVEALGAEAIYRTDLQGTVEVITDGRALRIITER